MTNKWGVVVTRPEPYAHALCDQLQLKGFFPIPLPALVLTPCLDSEQAHRALMDADKAIFVSRTAVSVACAVEHMQWSEQCFAVGSATARALKAQGLLAHVPPPPFNSEALLALDALQNVAGERIVLVCGHEGRTLLKSTLLARGADVVSLYCYQRACPATWSHASLSQWRTHGRVCIVTSQKSLDCLLTLPTAWVNLVYDTPMLVPSERLCAYAQQKGVKEVCCVGATEDEIVNYVEGMQR